MKRSLLPVIPALLLTAAIFSGGALVTSPARGQSAQQQLSDATLRTTRLQADLDLAEKKLSRTKSLYQAGQAPVGEVEEAQAKVENLSRDLHQALQDRKDAAASVAFTRPVTIQLDHASVRQFAAALSKATGISVKVDSSVPTNASTMLTLDAQAVPFANVVESIAEKADLMIVSDDGGVILKNWPHLNNRVLRSPIAPWSSDWVVPPTVGPGFGALGRVAAGLFGAGGENGGGLQGAGPANGFIPFGGGGQNVPAQGGIPGAGGANNAFGQQPGQPGFDPRSQQPGQPGFDPRSQQPGQGGFGPGGGGFPGQGGFGPGPGGMGGNQGMGGGLPFSITSIGDKMIVIAEMGPSDKGEPGVWMTAYTLDGGSFKKVGRGFHAFTNVGRGMQGFPGGPPDGRGGQPGQFNPGGQRPPQLPGRNGGPNPPPQAGLGIPRGQAPGSLGGAPAVPPSPGGNAGR